MGASSLRRASECGSLLISALRLYPIFHLSTQNKAWYKSESSVYRDGRCRACGPVFAGTVCWAASALGGAEWLGGTAPSSTRVCVSQCCSKWAVDIAIPRPTTSWWALPQCMSVWVSPKEPGHGSDFNNFPSLDSKCVLAPLSGASGNFEQKREWLWHKLTPHLWPHIQSQKAARLSDMDTSRWWHRGRGLKPHSSLPFQPRFCTRPAF